MGAAEEAVQIENPASCAGLLFLYLLIIKLLGILANQDLSWYLFLLC
jgi:hypothetical protein